MNAVLTPAGPSHAPQGRELRVSERIACDVPASCQPPSDWKRGGRKWAARVRDVSTGGLGLVVERRFERGAGLAIEVPGADGDSASTLLARVMHVRSEGGMWVLGCSFVSPLSDEELEALTRSAVPEYAPGAVADVHFFGTLPGRGVVRRYLRKLNVEGQWPLAAGRVIGLRYRDPSGEERTLGVRVDACREAGSGWVLETTFVRPAPASV